MASTPSKSTEITPIKKPHGCGKPGRSGPPKANINAAKTGQNISRLTLGELPTTMRRQLQNARKYRRFIENLVLEAHGEVNATHAHLIDEATCAEVHSAICRWLMRSRLETMSASDITRCSEQILKAKTIRNKAIERLKLNVPPEPLSLRDYVMEVVPRSGRATEK